jgi:glucokinase
MGPARLVGIDLGGTAIKAGAADREGRVLQEASVELDPSGEPGPVLDQMAELARRLGVTGCLGVGVPGVLERATGILRTSPNLQRFADVHVARELARRLELAPEHVHVENDANAAALGEQWLGAARGESDVMMVTLGTGIGGGLIFGGQLFVGAGTAGEIGHVIVEPGGPVCGCGMHGCLETLASANAARRRALEAGLPEERPGDLVLLAARARAGATPEARLLHAIGRDLGRGLAVVVGLLDLHTFVIGGGFAAALDTLAGGVREGVAAALGFGRDKHVELLAAELGPRAGWIGAASLCRGPLSSRE